MKRIILLSIISLIVSNFAVSQDKILSIDEAVMGAYRQFSPQDFISLQWRANDINYTYVEEYSKIIQADINSDKTEIILDLKDLNKVLESKKKKALAYIYSYSWIDFNTISLNNESRIVHYNVLSKELILDAETPKSSENPSFCKENNAFAFTLENNLYYQNEEGKQTQITNYEDKNLVCGASVSRNEFGISGGIFWSPKGSSLAFFRKNEDDVTNYPIVDITSRIAEVKNIKYPMVGEESENVALGIYNISSGKTIWIEDEPESEKYLTCITWGPSEEYIYIAVLNREQNHMKLNKYEVTTGNFVKTLFEEKQEKYVEPEHDLYFVKNKPEEFIWQSERDGFNHLYLYNTDGKLLKQLTKGRWVVTEILDFDKKARNLYYVSTEESPIERNLYKLDLKKGTSQKIGKTIGTHTYTLSENSEFIIDSYSNTGAPRNIDILSNTGVIYRPILEAENPLKDFNLPQMELLTLKSADGETDLHARIVKPLGYQEGKKYPVIVYVYGGPHAQLVNNKWLGGARLWDYYMAQQGYVVFTLDNRGSANRGRDFENVIHRSCGQNEMLDQMQGIEYLQSLPFVDTDRIGVHGWSYGGFMTISLLTNYPETFKVGVAGGPVIDWKYYEIMYAERYMDTPQENPEGYKKTSLLEKAKDLKSDLLIIHGYIDGTVVPQHSLDFLRAAEKEKVLVDFYAYPTHEHNVRGSDRIHLMRKVTKYFNDYLR